MLTIHHRLACLALVFSAAIASPYASLSAQDADLIVRNARIWTGDSTRPRAEAFAENGSSRWGRTHKRMPIVARARGSSTPGVAS
jgi:hypothetical protein